jgi:hypothetical protein
MLRLVFRSTEIAALARARERAAKPLVERSKFSRQLGAGLQQHAKQRSLDFRCVGVA